MGIPKAWDKELGKKMWLQGRADSEIAKACCVAQGTISYYRSKHWEPEAAAQVASMEAIPVDATSACGEEDAACNDDAAARGFLEAVAPCSADENEEVAAGDGGEKLGGNHMCDCKNGNLQDTAALMASTDYKERFVAEYRQTKIRYERLKAFNTKIEAARQVAHTVDKYKCPMPEHDCPDDLLREQQKVMGEYLHILEVRAAIEGIEL